MSNDLAIFLGNNNTRLNNLVGKFSGHILEVDRAAITAWLSQFESRDWELALKLLETVDYYSQNRVYNDSVQLHSQATGTLGADAKNTYAVAFGEAGKSGDDILYRYRLKNGLKLEQIKRLTDLPSMGPSARVILLDDFIGSGNQTLETWKGIAWSVDPERVVIAVHVAFKDGIDFVEKNTRLRIICNRVLTEADRVFSPASTFFSQEEKERLKTYCLRARDNPEGYRQGQAKVIFYYRAPNNCISILRANSSRWRGLFLRNPS